MNRVCFIVSMLGLVCSSAGLNANPPPVASGVVRFEVSDQGLDQRSEYQPNLTGGYLPVVYRKVSRSLPVDDPDRTRTHTYWQPPVFSAAFTRDAGVPRQVLSPDRFTVDKRSTTGLNYDYEVEYDTSGVLRVERIKYFHQNGTPDSYLHYSLDPDAYTLRLAGVDGTHTGRLFQGYMATGVTRREGPSVRGNVPEFRGYIWGFGWYVTPSGNLAEPWIMHYRPGIFGRLHLQGASHIQGGARQSGVYADVWLSSGYGLKYLGPVDLTQSGGTYVTESIPLSAAEAGETLAGLDWQDTGDYALGPDPTAHYAFSPDNSSASKLRYKLGLPAGPARPVVWLETFTPADATAPEHYRMKSEQVSAGATETQEYLLDPFAWRGTEPGTYRVLPIEATLAVDANRDGFLTPPTADPTLSTDKPVDTTSPDTPFRFWVNDDDDNGEDINGDDTPGAVAPDGQQVKVQGTRDLVDFFPVFLDLKQLLTVLPPSASAKYKLKNADDGLRFAYTDLSRTDAFKYLKDSATGNSLKDVDAHWVTAAGYELDAIWLGQVKDADKGVILVEGRNATDKPLVLSVEKTDGTVIAEVKLELKIVPVETMFRHLNLHDRNLPGLVGAMPGGTAPIEAMDDPTGFPDNPNSDTRWLIFVHGFNVSGQGGRGWNAEMFKRCYWSGNKSRFVGVSWFGNPDQVIGAISDYHLAMRNAMVTAAVFAQEINALPGAASTKNLFAHSLGCGVISSAIADHGMNIGRASFVDAALALECFDGRNPDGFTSENDGMTPAVWKPYSPRLYAANWFTRFDQTTDARGKLTWNNRFSGASSVVYNFYSSTEDVLAEYTGELPSTLGGIIWADGHLGTFGWVYQEKGKGNRQNYGLGVGELTHLGSYYGGWGMNLKDPVLSGDTPYWKWVNSESYIGRAIKTPAEIGTGNDSMLPRHPVFEPGWGVVRNQEQQEGPVSNVSPVDGAPSWIYDLYLGTTGNTLAGIPGNRSQLLAEAIPSLTWCLGSHKSDSAISNTRNFNLPTLVDQANWPRDKINNVPEWRHSDMREVAYLYQYGVFDKIVALSKP